MVSKKKAIALVTVPLIAGGLGAVAISSQAGASHISRPDVAVQLAQTQQRFNGQLRIGARASLPDGTIAQGVVRTADETLVCHAVEWKRGGGTTGCQPTKTGLLEKVSIGVTYLGEDTFGVDGAFPAGAHNVTLKGSDGRSVRPITLSSGLTALELSRKEIGELFWTDVAGVRHTESVAALAGDLTSDEAGK